MANAEGIYTVCTTCGLGKLDPDGEKGEPIAAFERDHAGHGRLEIMSEPTFRSQWLPRGFEDVDRPNLEPMVLSMGGSAPAGDGVLREMPFGAPKSKQDAAAAARKAARSLQIGSAFANHTVKELDPLLLRDDTPAERRAGLDRAHDAAAARQAEVERSMIRLTMRPTWDQTFLEIAFVLAKRGTCSRRQVGALLVKDTRIVSEGYNGAPAGLRHCDHTDDGDMIDGHCAVAEHAERNALLFAGREARGGTMYVTCTPCLPCTRMSVTAGVRKIVYANEYRPDRAVDELCAAAGIELLCLNTPQGRSSAGDTPQTA